MDPLVVIKEAAQGVDLRDSNEEHDKQVDAGPEGHPPQVVLQKVSVPCLVDPQHGLHLAAPLQVKVHRIHPHLEKKENKGRQEETNKCKKNDIRSFRFTSLFFLLTLMSSSL